METMERHGRQTTGTGHAGLPVPEGCTPVRIADVFGRSKIDASRAVIDLAVLFEKSSVA